MRASVFLLFVLGILACAHSASAGLSTTPREMPPSADRASSAEDANQQTEDQIGLSRAKRRDVQRGLTRLGFGTKVNGKFDEQTRDAITRWQDDHGYPKTGFLNASQHKTLMNESTAAAEADRAERRGGRRARRAHGIGGPIGAIGHVVGGLFRR